MIRRVIYDFEKWQYKNDGLFVNANARFDSKKFRDKCSQYRVIANTALNPRNDRENEDVYEQNSR